MYKFTAYICGFTEASHRALDELDKTLCARLGSTDYELKIINVMSQPSVALENKVFATPTVIKESPLPMRRVVGQLSCKDDLIEGLNL